jgi:3-hydroxyacyl-[acyl-carrier-protein] dehydratase
MNSVKTVQLKEILTLIPHRDPFVQIDSVDILDRGKLAKGHRFLDSNDEIFKGHFPENPIFPGVLITEALAQTAAVLLNEEARFKLEEANDLSAHDNHCGYLARTDIKFLIPVLPNSRLVLEVRKIGQVENLFQLQVRAFVKEKIVCEGKISVSHPAGERK